MRITPSLFIALLPILSISAFDVMVNVQDLDLVETTSHLQIAAVDFYPTGLTFVVDGDGKFTLFGSCSRTRLKTGNYGSGPGEFYWMPNAGEEGKIRCNLKGEVPADAESDPKYEDPKWIIALPKETARGPCKPKWGVSLECDEKVECYTGSRPQPGDDNYVAPPRPSLSS